MFLRAERLHAQAEAFNLRGRWAERIETPLLHQSHGEEFLQVLGGMKAAGRPQTTIVLRTYHVRRAMREVQVDPWTVTTEQLVVWLASKDWKPTPGAPNGRRCGRSTGGHKPPADAATTPRR